MVLVEKGMYDFGGKKEIYAFGGSKSTDYLHELT